MEEIWKDIPNFKGYQASNLGRIRTHNKTTFTKRHGVRHWKDRILKFKMANHKKGGCRVDLWKNGKPKTCLVHRLIATTFLENLIDTDMTVNHKDGNRLNNNIENLEWLSLEDNIRDGFEKGFYTVQFKTMVINKNTNEKHICRSMCEASRYMGKNINYVKCCKLKGNFENKDFIWRIL